MSDATFGACVTTRHRPDALEDCLKHLWGGTVRPEAVVVSDDSSEEAAIAKNKELCAAYPGTQYLSGPRKGVCANRNNAIRGLNSGQYVCFTDDDINVTSSFFATARKLYAELPDPEKVILTGISRTQDGNEIKAVKNEFLGHFALVGPGEIPTSVNIHATIFPIEAAKKIHWDENMFFGYEDAEIAMRCVRHGYRLQYSDALIADHTHFGTGNYNVADGKLSQVEKHIESARLYFGLKRYKYLEPNPVKLAAFSATFFPHLLLYLSKKGAISVFPEIIQKSAWKKALAAPEFP